MLRIASTAGSDEAAHVDQDVRELRKWLAEHAERRCDLVQLDFEVVKDSRDVLRAITSGPMQSPGRQAILAREALELLMRGEPNE